MLVSRSQLCDATRGKLVIDMKKHRRSARPARHSRRAQAAASTPELPGAYRRACHLAADGQHDEARRLYAELGASASDARLQALITNDLATLDAVNGDFDAARRGLEEALAIDESCRPARLNLELLVNRLGLPRETACDVEAGPARAEPRPPEIAEPDATPALRAGPALRAPGAAPALGAGLMTPPSTRPQVSPAWMEPSTRPQVSSACTGPCPPAVPESQIKSAEVDEASAGFLMLVREGEGEPADAGIGVMDTAGSPQAEPSRPTRVAVLSFLFNWPSTGGGNIHTVELATFLGQAGYEVCHLYVRFPQWGIGQVGDVLPFESQAMEFDRSSWELKEIQACYRRAVRSFDPDYVIITDAWKDRKSTL